MNATSVAAFAAFALLMLAPSATAQLAVPTYLELVPEHPPEANNWTGAPLDLTLRAALCWDDPGGSNPDEQVINVTATTHTMDGYRAEVDPETVQFVPPTGPTTGPGCTQLEDLTVTLFANETVAPRTEVDVSVTLTTTEGDHAGTFAPPPGAAASFNVTTTDDEDLIVEDPDPDADPPATPGPAAALVLLVTLTLVLLRRRRS